MLRVADTTFLQTEGLWQSCFKQVYGYNFAKSICSLHVSMSHFDHYCNISNVFIIVVFITVICDQ